MAKVLVAGGLFDDGEIGEARVRFAAALGRCLIERGHVVLGGCRTALDAIVAEAAATAAKDRKLDPRRVVRSWVTATTKPSHRCGELMRSQLDDWSQVPRGLVYPETVQEADVVLVVGGWHGTHFAASWARLAAKPLLPVATFGLAAAEIYKDEVLTFERRYGMRLTLNDYQTLNRVLSDFEQDTITEFARDVVVLAESSIASSEVFIVMSFAERGELKDAYNTFCRVCKNKEFHAYKVDHHVDPKQRIVPTIFDSIRRCAFVIADVTDAKPNVYYELGYARALGKAVIQTAREGINLPFDVYDVPTLFWDCQDTLEQKLGPAIDNIAPPSVR
jgi:hypothetical protein